MSGKHLREDPRHSRPKSNKGDSHEIVTDESFSGDWLDKAFDDRNDDEDDNLDYHGMSSGSKRAIGIGCLALIVFVAICFAMIVSSCCELFGANELLDWDDVDL